MTKAVTVVSLFVFAAFCVRSIIMRSPIVDMDDDVLGQGCGNPWVVGGGCSRDDDSTYYSVYRRLVYSKENNN